MQAAADSKSQPRGLLALPASLLRSMFCNWFSVFELADLAFLSQPLHAAVDDAVSDQLAMC
jgi:hypothetical protein